MNALPWSLIGLPDGFSCTNLELRFADAFTGQVGGRVVKPETINYRSYAGEPGGLFDEAIFGDVDGGSLPSLQAALIEEFDGLPGDDEPTRPQPRRDRFGVLELCEPVVHPSLLLRGAAWLERRTGIEAPQLREIACRGRHVVVGDVDGQREPGSTISADDVAALAADELDALDLETGPAAIRSLLLRRGDDVDPTVERVYVLPIQLRPLVLLEDAQFESADLNEHYRRVVNRNSRLAKLVELDAPEIILRNERAMLQVALDSLHDNAVASQVVTGQHQRVLTSLHDLAGGDALAERLRELDAWIGQRGVVEDGMPWRLFRTWRALAAIGLEVVRR